MSDLKHSDGGPAFPITTVFNPHSGEPVNTGQYWDGNGMSLRDWFAGMALQQLCAGAGARMVADRDERYNETNWKEVVAANAYEFADAMLQERMKPKP